MIWILGRAQFGCQRAGHQRLRLLVRERCRGAGLAGRATREGNKKKAGNRQKEKQRKSAHMDQSNGHFESMHCGQVLLVV
jgi:hypothetical protein